jgi:hypothetical protein
MRSKLERLVKKNKELNAQRAFELRCLERRHEFSPIWAEFLAAISDPAKRSLMPSHADACNLPVINTMLFEDKARIPVTEQRWLAIVDLILAQVEQFQANVKRALIKCLKTKSEDWYWHDADENSDFAILEKPSSLFTCSMRVCNELIGYPAIFRHAHMWDLMWSHVAARLYHEPRIEHTVNMVLQLLQLPGDTSLAAMEGLDGRLVCLCGHPKFRKTMAFGSLVRPHALLLFTPFFIMISDSSYS